MTVDPVIASSFEWPGLAQQQITAHLVLQDAWHAYKCRHHYGNPHWLLAWPDTWLPLLTRSPLPSRMDVMYVSSQPICMDLMISCMGCTTELYAYNTWLRQ